MIFTQYTINVIFTYNVNATTQVTTQQETEAVWLMRPHHNRYAEVPETGLLPFVLLTSIVKCRSSPSSNSCSS